MNLLFGVVRPEYHTFLVIKCYNIKIKIFYVQIIRTLLFSLPTKGDCDKLYCQKLCLPNHFYEKCLASMKS